MSKALVAHITAYDKDEEVRNHLEQLHDRQIDRSFRLAKNKGFANELVKKLKPFLYGLRIEHKLQRLFNGESMVGYPALSAGRQRDILGGRSITHELADLVNDISTHWKDLEPDVQQRIQENFNVTVDGDRVTVSLF